MNANELITAALSKLLSSKEYDDITVTDICKEAGYTRMSFYRNFNSKEDILIKAFHNNFTKFMAENKDEKGFSIFFTFYKDNMDLIKNIYRANKQQLIIEQLLLSCGYSDELSLEAQYAISYFAYSFFSFLNTWYKRGMIESPEQIQNMMNNNIPQ